MHRHLIRVWLPDRPGALGHVASRIGAIGGDLTGIEILERGAGMAIDELTVELPDGVTPVALVEAILTVDGVAVEDVHLAPPSRQEVALRALQTAWRTVAAPRGRRVAVLCAEVVESYGADWGAVMDGDDIVVAIGDLPSPAWLSAFVEGARHGADGAAAASADDVAWADIVGTGAAIVVGRATPAFRHRERDELLHLALIAGAADTDEPSVRFDPVARTLDGPEPLPVELVGR